MGKISIKLFTVLIAVMLFIPLVNAEVVIQSNSGDAYVAINTSNTERMRVESDGDVGIGTASPGNYRLNVQSSGDYDNYIFYGSGSTTGEKDVFTIYDNDNGGGGQDESSTLKVYRTGDIDADSDGQSLLELTYTGGTVSGDRTFYTLGRLEDEGTVRWGVSLEDSDIWTEGSLRGGATGTGCGGTGAACFNSATFALEDAADSYINTGNGLMIGGTSTSYALEVSQATGNVYLQGAVYLGDTNSYFDTNGDLTISGYANVDNVRIGSSDDNTIDTSSGNLILDSTSGTVDINDNIDADGTTAAFDYTTVDINSGNVDIDGVTHMDNINVNGNTVTTDSGNLILDSTGGTVDINDNIDADGTTAAFDFTNIDINSGNVDIDGLTHLDNINVDGNSIYSVTAGITVYDNSGSSVNIGQDSDNIYLAGQYGGTGVTISSAGDLSMDGDLIVDGISTFKDDVFFEQNVFFGGNFSRVDVQELDVNGSIIPAFDDTYDLGTATLEWRNIYSDGTIYSDGISMGGNIDMNDNNLLDANTVQANTLEDPEDSTLTVSDDLSVTGDVYATEFEGNFCPDGVATCDPASNEALTPAGLGATNIYAGSGGEVDFQDPFNMNGDDIRGINYLEDTGNTQRIFFDSGNNEVEILNSDLIASQDLSVNGGDITITNNNGGIDFNDATAYWLKTATNWGLYWNTAENQLEFHGSGTERGYVDLDNGNLQMDGTGTFGALTVNGNSDFTDGSLLNVREIELKDWDSDTGGADDSVRVLRRDDNWVFYNGGIVVGGFSNDAIGDIADGDAVVGTSLRVGSYGDPAATLDVDGNIDADGTTAAFDYTTVDINSANVDIDGVTHMDNINVDGNTVTTDSGNLILDSTGGLLDVNDNADISGSLNMGGNIVMNDNNINDANTIQANTLEDPEDGVLVVNDALQSDGIDSLYLASEENSGIYIASPQGAKYTTTTSSVTGAIKITLPVSWTSTMMRMTVDVYEYDADESFTVNFGGYNYAGSSAWYNTFATIEGDDSDRDFSVRFGHDGSKCAIYIGETTSSWAYPQVTVRDFYAGYGSATEANWADGWSIGFTETLGTITQTESSNYPWSDWNRMKNIPSGFSDGTDNYIGNAGGHTAGGALDMNGNKIENLADPDSGDDAMDRDYADSRYINSGWDLLTDGTHRDDIGDNEDVGFDSGTGIDVAWDGSRDVGFSFDCSDVEGDDIDCSGESIALEPEIEVDQITVGGGYGSTGATIYSNGDIKMNGDLYVDGSTYKVDTLEYDGNLYVSDILRVGTGVDGTETNYLQVTDDGYISDNDDAVTIDDDLTVSDDSVFNGEITATADENTNNMFSFTGYSSSTGQKTVFYIEDPDSGGGGQDESASLEVVKSSSFNSVDDGSSAIAVTLANSGDDSIGYIYGRHTVDSTIQWGIDSDENIWTEGSVHVGATGTDCGGTGAACHSSQTITLDSGGTVTAGTYACSAGECVPGTIVDESTLTCADIPGVDCDGDATDDDDDIAVEDDDSSVDSSVFTIDFGNGLDVSSDGASEVDVVANCEEITGSSALCDGSDATNDNDDIWIENDDVDFDNSVYGINFADGFADATANDDGVAVSIGAGGGITVNADSVAHTDTSSQATVDNSGVTYIQDVTLDTYGHVSGLVSDAIACTDLASADVCDDDDYIGDAASHTAGGNLDMNGFTISDTSDEVDIADDLATTGDIYVGGGQVEVNSGNAYNKYCMWGDGDSTYCIGMYSAQTYGGLADYAMTFTMNADSDRGFLWRDNSDAASDGAMSLTTAGVLTVKSTVTASDFICSGSGCISSGDLQLQKDLVAGTGLSGGANDILPGSDSDVTVNLEMLRDLVVSGEGMSGGGNDVLAGEDADVTVTLTTNKDIVAGDGLSGGSDNVLPGADSDVTVALMDCAANEVLQRNAGDTAWECSSSAGADGYIGDSGADHDAGDDLDMNGFTIYDSTDDVDINDADGLSIHNGAESTSIWTDSSGDTHVDNTGGDYIIHIG